MIDVQISIIIPVFNSELLIERCLDSVFRGLDSFCGEVIVVDDGSNDNGISIIKSKFPAAKIITQKNQGPAAARNRGIEASNGKYLAFLDADDYWLPGFLERTVSFLESYPDVVAVSVGQEHHLTSGKVSISPTILLENHHLQDIVLDDFFSFWAAQNHVCTGSVLMRTDIVKQTGGQRPELRITEDLEFWAYLATFGKWGFIPEVLFVSDGGQVTKSQGWWEKNLKRWKSAPSIEEWEKRILKSKPDLKRNKGYKLATGRICKNLAYSAILSDRLELSRKMILERGATFPEDKLAKLLRSTASNPIIFFLSAKLLKNRERFRKV